MALAALSGDEQLVIFVQLCNVLDPGVAVAFGSASKELWELTQAPRQQLQADYEAAAALGRKAGKRSCKELREAKVVDWRYKKGLTADELTEAAPSAPASLCGPRPRLKTARHNPNLNPNLALAARSAREGSHIPNRDYPPPRS